MWLKMTKLQGREKRMSSKITVHVDCKAMHDIWGNRVSMEENRVIKEEKGVNVE
jgi:hypothetical protein